MMICWTHEPSAASRCFARPSRIWWIEESCVAAASIFGFTAPARQGNLGSSLFHDQRRMNGKETWIQEKNLIWATISTWQGAHGGLLYPSCFPAISPFMARGSI
ncbi:hypothetical protein CPLU01_08322 [Colletotrichum plurivorum]|uniref:Uncharacterized protein n=1 Tax=Colletotrichum plurivorum TaxID=2175906 RepID=A0A8H6KD12_9PEZI|nr:hypothetical protein CPLU01_08322 [Colletotrichum plurivorum]